METHTFVTNGYARKGQIIDLQVSTNTIFHSVNQIQEKVTDVKDKMDSSLCEISSKSRESWRNHEELMEGLGQDFSKMGKTLTQIRQKDSVPDKPIPDPFILPNPSISILSLVYKPSQTKIQKKFPHHFPPEEDIPESSSKPESKDHLSLVSIQQPTYENIPHHTSRPPAPDLMGKGKLPESPTFAED